MAFVASVFVLPASLARSPACFRSVKQSPENQIMAARVRAVSIGVALSPLSPAESVALPIRRGDVSQADELDCFFILQVCAARLPPHIGRGSSSRNSAPETRKSALVLATATGLPLLPILRRSI